MINFDLVERRGLGAGKIVQIELLHDLRTRLKTELATCPNAPLSWYGKMLENIDEELQNL